MRYDVSSSPATERDGIAMSTEGDAGTVFNTEGPLQGLRVLALEQAVAGPLCTRPLADPRAGGNKIERPGGGGLARPHETPVEGLSSYFVLLHLGKSSLALAMKK